MNCTGKFFNRKAQPGGVCSYLPSSLSVDVFSSLMCAVRLATYSAPECKVIDLVCHCSLALISVSLFLVMSGYFISCNDTEFLGS